MDSRRIYLDYNATTPLCEPAARVMGEAAGRVWGNPSSVHREGQRARAAVERARGQVAELIGAAPAELRFTSGATEAINWAHRALPVPGALITTAVEHPAVLEASRAAAEAGGRRIVLPVDGHGCLALDDLDRALEAHAPVALVSVMLANNEIGVLQPVAEVAARCRARGILCHSDATQAVGRIPVNARALGVDLLSFSAHKLYGPKGVGALWVRAGSAFPGFVVGGHQERGVRGGTENLLGILGFGAAAAAGTDLEGEGARQRGLIDRLWANLSAKVANVVRNGDPARSMPNTLNVSFLGCEAEGLLIALDLEGVAISAGSACSAGSLEPSHVLKAITDDPERQKSAVRFSVGRPTTVEEIDAALPRIVRCVARLRG